MIGRLRIADIVLGLLGLLLAAGVVRLNVFTGQGGDLTVWDTLPVLRWVLLGCALLAVLDPIFVVTRRTATAGLFVEVLMFLVSLPVMLFCVLRVLVFTPDRDGQALSATLSGGLLAGLTLCVFISAVWAMRDESRGLSPAPGAEIGQLEAPGAPGSSRSI